MDVAFALWLPAALALVGSAESPAISAASAVRETLPGCPLLSPFSCISVRVPVSASVTGFTSSSLFY